MHQAAQGFRTRSLNPQALSGEVVPGGSWLSPGGGCAWELLVVPGTLRLLRAFPALPLVASGRSWRVLAAPGGGLWEVSFLYRKTATGTITNTIIIEEIKSFSLLNVLY